MKTEFTKVMTFIVHALFGAFLGFILCSLQFDKLTLAQLCYKEEVLQGKLFTLAPESLPIDLEIVESKEKIERSENPDLMLSDLPKWNETKEKAAQYSQLLKLQQNFIRDMEEKISKIRSRDSTIVFVSIIVIGGCDVFRKTYAKRLASSGNIEGKQAKNTLSYKAGKLYVRLFKKR